MKTMQKFIGDKAFYRRMLAVVLPIIIQNGIANFVSLLDNIMVGQVGQIPMSGVAIVNQLMFVFNLRGLGTSEVFNGTNISDEIFTAVQQMWTNFARCGDPSTDQIEWKAYSAGDQNVLVIAGPGDIHIEQGILADQYKAVVYTKLVRSIAEGIAAIEYFDTCALDILRKQKPDFSEFLTEQR